MDVKATTRFVRLSSSKARGVARRVQGMAVADALKVTELTAGKAAQIIGKTLKSAIANAENNAELSVDDLKVKVAVVEEGPRYRRFWPRARGGASRIAKRTSHVRIVLTDGKTDEAEAEA